MIRDEFNKQKNTLTLKEMEGIKKYGERAFYGTEIKRILSVLKTLNFTFVMLTITATVFAVFLIVALVNKASALLNAKGYAMMAITFALYTASAVWAFAIVPSRMKKINKYKQNIENLTRKEMEKQKSIYNKINIKEN